MTRIRFIQFRSILSIIILSSFLISCSTQATSRYWGQTVAPTDNTLHYISGSEIESLDPAVTNSQVDARILVALYDGLVEYHPKTMEPIPAIAESWEISPDGTEYLFHLRKNAKFSNGDPITANDFVYTVRRGFSPELASRNASLAYYIKYSEAYNGHRVFVRDAGGQFLLKKDFEEPTGAAAPTEKTVPDNFSADTEFHKFLDAPERLTVPSDEKERAKLTEKDENANGVAVTRLLEQVAAPDRIFEFFGGLGAMTATARFLFPTSKIESWDLDPRCAELIRERVPGIDVICGDSINQLVPTSGSGVLMDWNVWTLQRANGQYARVMERVFAAKPLWIQVADSSMSKFHINKRSYGVETEAEYWQAIDAWARRYGYRLSAKERAHWKTWMLMFEPEK